RGAKVETRTDRLGLFRVQPLEKASYRVTFTRPGFRTVVRENVGVGDSGTAIADLVLLEWTDRQIVWSADDLEPLPNARDTGAVLGLRPAVVLRPSLRVGGTSQQPSPAARGEGMTDVTWRVDGTSVTDLVALGATPRYFDFDSLESIGVTTAGGDARQRTAGVNLSLMTRSGSDVLRGSAR